jgi:Spy/CpxP family protein refolding chaperone
MTRSKKWMIVGLTAAALGGGALVAHRAWAMGRRGFGKMMIEHRVDDLLDTISATQDQRDAAHADLTKAEDAFEAFRTQQQSMTDDLLTEFQKPTMDSTKLASLDEERVNAVKDLQSTLEGVMVDMHDRLTPEQRSQIVSIIEEKRAEHQERWGGRDDDDDDGAPAQAPAPDVAPQR